MYNPLPSVYSWFHRKNIAEPIISLQDKQPVQPSQCSYSCIQKKINECCNSLIYTTDNKPPVKNTSIYQN